MNKSPLMTLIVLLSLVLVGVGIATFLYNRNELKPVPLGINLREELVRPDSHAMGSENARLTIVEFLDPECEACKAFHPTMKKFMDQNKANVRLVVRYMPFHTSSVMAIAALESAALQNRYWEFLDTLFENAEEWGHKERPDPTFFEKYAQLLGLNVEKFRSDMQDPRWATLAQRDMQDGQTLGVKGTPTVYFNGELLRGLRYENLVDAANLQLGGGAK